jgi:hypothetical protein
MNARAFRHLDDDEPEAFEGDGLGIEKEGRVEQSAVVRGRGDVRTHSLHRIGVDPDQTAIGVDTEDNIAALAVQECADSIVEAPGNLRVRLLEFEANGFETLLILCLERSCP